MILEEDLKLGSYGDNVKIVQEKLKILGLYNPVISGSFGLALEQSVKLFQKKYNLEETGIVNKETWDYLFKLTEPAMDEREYNPTLSLNSTGTYVGELQRKLKVLLYYPEEVNEIFDVETENAVKRFQYNNKLTANGIVNNVVWNLINELYGNINSCVIKEEEKNDYYIVKAGDTLYSIAKKYGLTVNELKKLNNLTSDTLSIGQQLIIVPNNNDNNENNNQDLNIVYYPVVKGDTLYSIANRFNTTVDKIKSLNNLTSNTLNIGQILKIPSTSNYTYYTVKSGDTLYSIARKFNTTVDDIKKINNLTNNILTINQTLRIPI